MFYSNILRERSPFYQCFTQIWEKTKSNLDSSMVTFSNPHYYPDFITFLLKRYLYLLPLWTGSMLALSETICGHTKIQTNSIVEKWMGIVKQIILQKKLHMRPGDFLRKMHANVSQRISGLLFNIPKSSKKRRKRNEEHLEEAVEIWKAKKRKANYYHNPVLSSYQCQNSASLVNSPKKSENATVLQFSMQL